MKNNYHIKSIKEVENLFETNAINGLTSTEVTSRQEKYGKNKLKESKPKSLLKRFIEQISDFMVIVLLFASAISFIEHNTTEGFLILFIIIINAVLGIIQESKAEKSLQAIKRLSSPSAKVLRNRKEHVIQVEDLVPGDVILIDAGDYIPADIRIIESHSLKIDESALTGEAMPVEKKVAALNKEDISLGDRINCGYMSTVVTYGRGKGIVTSTGMETEIGHIANLLNETEFTHTPLQKNLEQLGKILAIVALLICGLIFLIGVLQGQSISEMFITAISLAVAAIPEGLPAIVTIVLALGMQHLVKQKAIMRKLPAVETLGSTNVICSDKTGTLTQNKMTIEQVYIDNIIKVRETDNIDDKLMHLITYGVLCNDTKVNIDGSEYKKIGDPTEVALIDLAINLKVDPIEIINKYERLYELPFDSERKLMSTVNLINGKRVSITKGAPDVLLSRCNSTNSNILNQINIANETMANQALRVLALGFKILDDERDLNTFKHEDLERNLIFIGLVGMIDPPREEAKQAIATCRNAGIKTIMITGDHKNTAVAIAKQLGILNNEKEAISGAELDKISEEEFINKIDNYRVYARVSPENKVRIVKTFQSKGMVVAMTGDGVNDAPALKSADIGIAMGITGTEVAKGAADMILTDDNFATIVNAVREGRTIFSNIKKAVYFLLSCNTGEIFTILLATLFGSLIFGQVVTPLTATQILWVNLVTDSMIAIALGLEKAEPNVMDKKPRDTRKSIFSEGLGVKIIIQGFILGVLSFLAYYLGDLLTNDPGIAKTMTFMTLAFSQLFHSFNTKSEDFSIFKIGLFSNKYLIYAFIFSSILQLGTIVFPFTREIFNIKMLNVNQFIIVFLLSTLPLVIVELSKLISKVFKGKN